MYKMKRYILLLVNIWIATAAFAQNDIHYILKQIEKNNPEIQANQQMMKAQTWDTKSNNNLTNPTVSYSHLWDSKDKNETESELEIAQEFEFPTAYIHRNKANKKTINALEALYETQRQEILLNAQEVCLDIIMLNQQQEILRQRLSYANQLFEAYDKMLDAGDATSIEVNKIKLERLNLQTEYTIHLADLNKKRAELVILNGNQPIEVNATEYSNVPLPSYELIHEEIFNTSYALKYAQSEYEAAEKQIALNKAGWFPHLEIGYKRNSGTGHHSNGFSVGFSIPLFNNRGKVSSAKAIAISKSFSKDLITNKLSTETYQTYEEAKAMREQMNIYEGSLDIDNILDLLNKALNGGELNITTYFVEVATVYQGAQNYLLISNLYQKQLAKLYKHRL